MNFSPPDFTFSDFEAATKSALAKFDFIHYVVCEVEDSVPWVNILANKVIKPKEALSIMESLQANITDEVLFNSLSGKDLRIVVNGKFHFKPEELTDFEEDYAHDFGITIEEMKKEYELTEKIKNKYPV